MQQQVILILIGWFTGVLSTVGYEQYKRYLDGKNLKTAILTELKVLLPRLVLSYFLLIIKSKECNKEKLQWVYDNLSLYEDKTIASKILSTKEKLKKLLKLDDASIKSGIALLAEKSEVEHIKSITLSFGKESITNFSLLSEELRLIIFDVRTKINVLNELADRIDFFFKQSFSPGMSSKNIEIIDNNIKSNYVVYFEYSKLVVERIKEIFELGKKHK
jgi:hypothetical protein